MLRELFGIDEGWARPVDVGPALRRDGLLALSVALVALLSVETSRSLGSLGEEGLGEWGSTAWVVLPTALLVVRRIAPVAVAVAALVHYVATAVVVPEVAPVFALQIFYFLALFSAVAWARQRWAAVAVSVAMLLGAVWWVVAEVVLHDAVAALRALPSLGRFGPVEAALLQAAVSSLTFLIASTLAGTAAWWSARREARSTEQAARLAEQGAQLRERALADERIRIARELHDVVGRHVALVGIQAAAARAVLRRDREAAEEAMRSVEEISRGATSDLRLLLSTLRVGDRRVAPAAAGVDLVVAGGDLTELPQLVRTYAGVGLEVDLVCDGDVTRLPLAVSVAAHRIVQEALTNVRRHSAASAARVEVGLDDVDELGGPDGPAVPRIRDDERIEGRLRLRISDPGPGVGDTSGSQLGVLGMRERVLLHHGRLRVGPGADGSFTVEAELWWSASGVRA